MDLYSIVLINKIFLLDWIVLQLLILSTTERTI